ncbi:MULTISPECIES: helix-turn-helix domain-containing protein [Rhodococcus]|uniref:helix-turn-helix domain-containing protein n=1 Tax=Rhodococcus TaxID=1827 RepID=UPI00051A51E9|nr:MULTISPECIES: PucR family transcriptional regulator [Rhodococcus]AOD20915.1 CdaR family transcriptional regulator [Rhodococcus sp. p52]KHJ71441.1 CdaR family transcriptional regulator [Rhodococcus sp. Chr-9]QXF82572.1 PucR family transcriptional regulator [Rhodococcus pyridinivorans]SEC08809.1 purine catabolism regulatory protein [Rhodococcus pyridinivorans]
MTVRKAEKPGPSAAEPDRSAADPEDSAAVAFEPCPLTDVVSSGFLVAPTVIAGDVSTARAVTGVAVMMLPEIGPWLRPGLLLVTSTTVLARLAVPIADFLARLDRSEVSALVVRLDTGHPLPQGLTDDVPLPVLTTPEEVVADHRLARDLRDMAVAQVEAVFEADHLRRGLLEIVMAGGGHRALAEGISRRLGGAVLITTPDGRQTYRAGKESDFAWLSSTAAVDATGRVRTDSIEGGLGLHRFGNEYVAIAAISANGIDHGRLVFFCPARDLSAPDLYLVEQAATVCALVVSRELAVSAVEEKHRANFVRDLLRGRAGEPEQVIVHAQMFGWNLDRPVVVVAVEPDRVDDDSSAAPARLPVVERQARAFAGALAGRDSGASVTALATETVVLMGEGSDTMTLVHELVAQVRGAGGGGRRPFGVGVSRASSSTDDLPVLYAQARTALEVGRKISGPWAVTHFDDLGVYRLLSLVEDTEELESFARETLKELTDGTAEAQDMCRTLEVLLATNINIAEAARQLHFHYNTLRYRVAKLEKILGPFTEQPELRLDLSLALKIIAMRGIDS